MPNIRLSIPITPPSPLGTFVGGHVYVECPDQSATTSSTVGVTAAGSGTLNGTWAPIDCGKQAYIAGQPLVVEFSTSAPTNRTVTIRVYVASYSPDVDKALVRYGLSGATPSVQVTIPAIRPVKTLSGSNITPLLVTGVTATVGAAVSVGGKLKRPISVTVDLSGLPTLPTNWGYQLQGYVDGDTSQMPLVVSGVFNYGGLIGCGADGITGTHTFGPDEPTSITSVEIFAVAGLISGDTVPNRGIGQAIPNTFTPNNIVPGITAACTVSIGTTGGTLVISDAVTSSIGDGVEVVAGKFQTALADGLTIVSGRVAPNLGGGMRINPSTQQIEPYNVDVTAFAATVRPVSIFTGANPGLPDTNYPSGSYGFRTTAPIGMVRVDAAGTAWVAAITSGDTDSSIVSASYLTANYITAGAIAAAYVTATYLTANYITAAAIASTYVTTTYLTTNYLTAGSISANYATIGALNAKTIAADHITTWTCSATVAFTSPIITVTSGGVTVNIDSSNFIKVSSSLGVSQLLTDRVSVSYGGHTVAMSANIGGTDLTIYPSISSSAVAGTATLPASPAGFLAWNIGGATMHIPYYN